MDKCLFDGLGEERNFRNEGWKLSARRIIYRRGEGRVQILYAKEFVKKKREKEMKREDMMPFYLNTMQRVTGDNK